MDVQRYPLLAIMRSVRSPVRYVPVALFVVLAGTFLFPIVRRNFSSVDYVNPTESTAVSALNDKGSEVGAFRRADVPLPESVGRGKSLGSNWADSLKAVSSEGNRSNAVIAADGAAERQKPTEVIESGQPGPGLVRTNNPELVPIEWIGIPPGKFVMGSPEEEPGRRSHEPQNEGPQTVVTIQNGFWLGKYEVTLGQFREITGNNPRRAYPWRANDLNVALANSSWSEAMKFCAALTVRERQSGRLPDGYVCRLPTEAEWEYACRAGSVTPYSFGVIDAATPIGAFAWFRENSERVPQYGGSKLPNPWGLYDMHGNVAEWCLDYLGMYPGGGITNPIGTIGGPLFVIRGGSWNHPAEACRSAWRHAMLYSDENGTIESGFRVAMASPVQ